jgi:hypothetical protein
MRLPQILLGLVIIVGTTGGRQAAAVVLYDPTAGTRLDQQGWLFAKSPPGSLATPQYDGTAVATRLDTTAAITDYAGFSTHNGITGAAVHPNAPTLDRTIGYTLTFHARVDAEQHNPNRGGFSVLAVSERVGLANPLAIELAFFGDEVWAYGITGTQFFKEESVSRSTAAMTRYDLTVAGSAYQLFADGGATPILSGALRDYSAFPGLEVLPGVFLDPYEKPNLIFLGDDTSSAMSDVRIGGVSVAAVPEPGGLALAACGVLAAAAAWLWRRR